MEHIILYTVYSVSSCLYNKGHGNTGSGRGINFVMPIRPPCPPPPKNKKMNLHTTLATPTSHHQPSPLQENPTLYTVREFAIPKRASYFPRDVDEKNGCTRCEIKAFTYMCTVVSIVLRTFIRQRSHAQKKFKSHGKKKYGSYMGVSCFRIKV